jgi:RNA polymerase sigma-70 factor (ECF subfamily)
MLKGSSDFDLVQGFVKSGDESCFLEIFNRHHTRVFRVAYKILRNEADAEDVVQEVFIKVLTKVHEFQFHCKFTSWIHRISANLALMRIRSQKRRPTTHIEDLPISEVDAFVEHRTDAKDIDYMTCRHELKAVLQDAVDALPIMYREVYCLRDIDGLSNKQVGDALQLTESLIKNRVFRARFLVKRKVAEYFVSCEMAA